MIQNSVILRAKEVILIVDGERVGFISDIEIDSETGKVTAICVPGAYKALGLLGKEPDTQFDGNVLRKSVMIWLLIQFEIKVYTIIIKPLSSSNSLFFCLFSRFLRTKDRRIFSTASRIFSLETCVYISVVFNCL